MKALLNDALSGLHGALAAGLMVVASPVAWFDGLSKGQKAVWAVGLLLTTGWGGGIATAALLSEFGTHEERIVSLERWREIHEDTVTAPGLSRIQENQAAIEGIRVELASVTAMVYALYCESFPRRCQGVPVPRERQDFPGGAP